MTDRPADDGGRDREQVGGGVTGGRPPGAMREEVVALAQAVLSVRPLIDVLPQPVVVLGGPPQGATASSFEGPLGAIRLLHRITSHLGAPHLEVRPGDAAGPPGPFERVVSDRLSLDTYGHSAAPFDVGLGDEIEEIVDAVVADSFDGFCSRSSVISEDGVAFPAYTAGDPTAAPVLVISACGMPAKLCEAWVRALAERYFVITWETRDLFLDGPGGADVPWDVAAQTSDAIAVLDHFGVRSAHLMGLCGGAVLALSAAASEPDRVESLSLWHGDLDLGPGHPKTDHQRNLQAVMTMTGEGKVSPAAVRATLGQTLLGQVPDLAHLVLYPFATPELLLRYCRLNGSIMTTDVRDYIPHVRQPTLIVTSEDDRTAHPGASSAVAAALEDARLHVAPTGDHISMFRGPAALLRLATEFIAAAARPALAPARHGPG